MGGRTNAVGPVPQVDLVEIELKDLLFAQFLLYTKCKKDLSKLAGKGSFRGEKEIARHLHGNGAATLPAFAASNQFDGSPQDTLVIHSRMPKETGIFGR